MKNDELVKILSVLAAAYPRFNLTPETITAYYEFLKDLPADELAAAARECATSYDFFPSVHELRKAVSGIRCKQRGVPSSYEAWQEVCHRPKDGNLRRVVEEDGQNIIEIIPVPWSHPLVERVAYQMGWPRFPESDEIGVDRAHFLRAYEYAMNDAIGDNIRLPEVTAYIESARSGPMRLGDVKYGQP